MKVPPALSPQWATQSISKNPGSVSSQTPTRRGISLFKSTPGLYVTLSAIAVVTLAWIIPYTPLGPILSFKALPLELLLLIGGIVLAYLLLAEISKYFFYKFFTKAP